MKEREKKYIALWLVMKRECRRLVSRPLYLFCMVIAPLFCYIFFTTLMDSGLPTNLPVGAVDMDQSATSRNLIRNLDAFGQTAVVAHYGSVLPCRKERFMASSISPKDYRQMRKASVSPRFHSIPTIPTS